MSDELENEVSICIHSVLSKALALGCAEAIKDDQNLNIDIWQFLTKDKVYDLGESLDKSMSGKHARRWSSHWEKQFSHTNSQPIPLLNMVQRNS